MPSKLGIQIIIWLFALLMLLVSFLTHQSLGHSWLSLTAKISSAIIVLTLIFDRWAWRWPIVRQVVQLTDRPLLHGTWKGKLEYDKDKDGKPGSTDLYLVIRQTFSSVEVFGYVPTSNSHSLTASLEKVDSDLKLVYIYRSAAPFGKRGTNPPHEGTAILNLVGKPVKEIEGSYFTARDGGSGRISLNKYSKKLAGSYKSAQGLSYKTK